jgi:hypothetical protein
MRGAALAVLLCTSGCIATWRRDEVQARLTHEHYAQAPITNARTTLEQLWESLQPANEFGCLTLIRPCRVPVQSAPHTFCFAWGKERTCFESDAEGRVKRLADARPTATERWIYEELDPDFAATQERFALAADDEISAQEHQPIDASSFWASARAVVQAPLFTLGVQAQGGYRRWLEPYLLLSVGAGYERTFTPPRGFDEPRDALLFTTRLELSVFDDSARQRLNLPPVSAYFGLTGVLGVTPVPSWTTRGFVGVSAVVPVSIELGYALSAFQNATLGQLYLAAGFGI